jgi:serine/threonine protein kinase
MRELDNPYIMKLSEVHESQNSLYLVLEILEGGELFNYIYEKG